MKRAILVNNPDYDIVIKRLFLLWYEISYIQHRWWNELVVQFPIFNQLYIQKQLIFMELKLCNFLVDPNEKQTYVPNYR